MNKTCVYILYTILYVHWALVSLPTVLSSEQTAHKGCKVAILRMRDCQQLLASHPCNGWHADDSILICQRPACFFCFSFAANAVGWGEWRFQAPSCYSSSRPAFNPPLPLTPLRGGGHTEVKVGNTPHDTPSYEQYRQLVCFDLMHGSIE